MKYNLRNQHEGLASCTQRLQKVESEQFKLFTLCSEIRDTLQTIASKVNREYLNIGSYFPLDSLDKIHKFMKADEMYDCRVLQFEDMLSGIARPPGDHKVTETIQSDFINNLLSKLFTRQFISISRWPSHK